MQLGRGSLAVPAPLLFPHPFPLGFGGKTFPETRKKTQRSFGGLVAAAVAVLVPPQHECSNEPPKFAGRDDGGSRPV